MHRHTRAYTNGKGHKEGERGDDSPFSVRVGGFVVKFVKRGWGWGVIGLEGGGGRGGEGMFKVALYCVPFRVALLEVKQSLLVAFLVFRSLLVIPTKKDRVDSAGKGDLLGVSVGVCERMRVCESV
jgi:hypothetical protein